MPGLEEYYGFDVPDSNIREMEIGLYYTALGNDEIDVTQAFVTDPQINSMDLKYWKMIRNFSLPTIMLLPSIRKLWMNTQK